MSKMLATQGRLTATRAGIWVALGAVALLASCSDPAVSNQCGDGTLDGNERCDDGNNLDGDGCSADCWSDETCGNGVVDVLGGENCDDGNITGGDGCSAVCSQEPPDPCPPDMTRPACDNCIDDDGDGLIDGFDPHCTMSGDVDESSFATGIPGGDNRDPSQSDCFFDGNTGSGDDLCNVHVCCELSGPCPYGNFDPSACAINPPCIDFCDPLPMPGCDCFGCCTVCNESGCNDVFIDVYTAPECDVPVIDDPAACPPCVKNTECRTDCEPGGCSLCPGQTLADLPASCGGVHTCLEGRAPCLYTSDCSAGEWCSLGCCIAQPL